jgi:hypothetical protein
VQNSPHANHVRNAKLGVLGEVVPTLLNVVRCLINTECLEKSVLGKHVDLGSDIANIVLNRFQAGHDLVDLGGELVDDTGDGFHITVACAVVRASALHAVQEHKG